MNSLQFPARVLRVQFAVFQVQTMARIDTSDFILEILLRLSVPPSHPLRAIKWLMLAEIRQLR